MNDESFSYVELLISLFLLSILSLLIYRSLNIVSIGGEHGWSIAKKTIQMVRLERQLRSEVSQLSAQWWGISRPPLDRAMFEVLISPYDSFTLVKIKVEENYLEFTLEDNEGLSILIRTSYGSFFLKEGGCE